MFRSPRLAPAPLLSVASLLALGTLASLGVIGCSSDEYRHMHDYGGAPPADCSEQTTCGSCTPVVGCGWCDYGDGTGSCVSGPSRCDGSTFRWNWDPETCPASPVDSGTVNDAGSDAADEVSSDASSEAAADTGAVDTGREPFDGSRDAVASDTTVDEVSSDASDASSADTAEAAVCTPPSDLGSPGCAVTTGGTACTGDVYTVGCHGDPGAMPTPNAALKCEATTIGATSGSQYYCCPCSH